ncbi:hypothetical protein [Bradyrhizobium sp. 153]|uniref:hypothetical protein n=1 Tax=Bradyrhizobium sp. 153 TaxID=2782627 RepID=UPI001FF91815|nr:hypothetical protein [Bradyrhizobium sp. 153]MCK1666311.1 hypothetical protein [Bradyrhizobium sp. 153]
MESDEAESAKRRMHDERRPYQVGYGKPPKATQFGVRPQPQRRTRPKSVYSRQSSKLTKFLDQPVEVKLNGRIAKLHPHEATLHGLFARIINGQLRPIKQFLRECQRAELLEAEVLQESSVIHVPKNVPMDLAGYILLREGPPPRDEGTLRPYFAEYERDLALLKLLKEEALLKARAGGENVY